MIKLINGRGQLGDALKQKLEYYSDIYEAYEKDIYIYHTWRLETKDKDEQEIEFDKFKTFVDEHKNDRIIFVSTYSNRDDWYVYHKQLSESYLLVNCPDGLVIKLPTFVGNHCDMFSIEKLNNGDVKPYGVMELISLENAVDNVYKFCNYNARPRVIRVDGEKISAELLYNIYKKLGVVSE
tara:strand:+ start:590 stop:1132 length:543 start_codon:yes stop_codon:yes gene_type:complete